jgi:hypothetical protein
MPFAQQHGLMSRAGERVGLDFRVPQTLAIETLGRARRQAPRQRGFSRNAPRLRRNPSARITNTVVTGCSAIPTSP